VAAAHRGLEQRRAEREHVGAVGGGALWTHGHHIAASEARADFGIDRQQRVSDLATVAVAPTRASTTASSQDT
jgi:hypothetical protein